MSETLQAAIGIVGLVLLSFGLVLIGLMLVPLEVPPFGLSPRRERRHGQRAEIHRASVVGCASSARESWASAQRLRGT